MHYVVVQARIDLRRLEVHVVGLCPSPISGGVKRRNKRKLNKEGKIKGRWTGACNMH